MQSAPGDGIRGEPKRTEQAPAGAAEDSNLFDELFGLRTLRMDGYVIPVPASPRYLCVILATKPAAGMMSVEAWACLTRSDQPASEP